MGPESRGFIFGVPVAYNMHKSFVPVRKKGKLPCETIEMEYELEYGKAVIEMHKDSIKPGQKVVIVDDLIATGGTTEAIVKLVEALGGAVVKICFLMELAGLKGRERLAGYDVFASSVFFFKLSRSVCNCCNVFVSACTGTGAIKNENVNIVVTIVMRNFFNGNSLQNEMYLQI